MRYPRLIAAIAGAATVLAFAPFALAPVAVATLALFFFLVTRAANPRAAALLGFVFGLAFFLAGVSWVYVSLHVFGMMPAPLAAIATLGFCAYLALFPAASAYVANKIDAGPIAGPLVVLPGVWVVTEWLRGWLFTGFPWLTVGYTQIDAPLAGFAPVLGVFGLSLGVALTAGAIVAMASVPSRARIALLALVVALHSGGWALQRVQWTQPRAETLRVALLQGNIPQELKFVPGRFESILETYERQIELSSARLIVLPETAVPRFLDEVDPQWLARVREHALKRNGDVILGIPTGNIRAEYFNSVISLGADPPQTYSKVHLVPFGEFVPPGFGWVVNVLRIPLSDFTRGAVAQRPLALAGEKIAINICYEDAFGAEIIRQLPEATLLVNVSNVAWFGDSLAPAQHLEISRMRSAETGRPMLRSTNTGVTAIVDARGREVKQLPQFTQGVLEGEVRGYTGTTPYIRFGDLPAFLAAFALAAAGGLWGRRIRARR